MGGTCLLDVTSHDLLVFILRKLDIETVCATSRVSAEFRVAARQSLRFIHSVSIKGTDTARKLKMIRTVAQHCAGLRQISAHFVDDLPIEDIARVFTNCRKLRSFRRVPPGVLRSIQIASCGSTTAMRQKLVQTVPPAASAFISNAPLEAVPASGDGDDVEMSDAPPLFENATHHASGGSIASSAPSLNHSGIIMEADPDGLMPYTRDMCHEMDAMEPAALAPAAPVEVSKSMELLTVDIECNEDLQAICDKFIDLKTIQLFNSIHNPLANPNITPILVKHHHLTFLSLYGFEITDEVFQAVSGLKTLQKLSLVDAELDNDDCAKIASAVSHVNLELLSVSENRDITMEGIAQLAPLTTIGALNIRGTSVGFGVLDALAESPHLFPKLVVLMVTQLSLIELTRRAPALKIRYIRA